MSQLYMSGPALLYVGVPTQLAGALVLPPVFGEPVPPPPPSPLGGGASLPFVVPLTTIVPKAYPIAIPPAQSSLVLALLRAYVPVYLGTTERGVSIEITPAFTEFHYDEAGKKIAGEFLYEGEDAWITCDLNVYNEPVYSILAARAAKSVFATPPFAVEAPRGLDLAGYVGTAMLAEGATIPLWVVSPYAGKLQMALGGMPPAYRFLSAIPHMDRLDPMGTRPKKVRIIFHAVRQDIGGSGTFILYDHDTTSPVLPPPG